MKKSLLFIFLLISLLSFADAGYGYRFSVSALSQNNDTINGYIYVYSWEKYKGFGNLESFLRKNLPYHELNIYPSIVTVNIRKENIDFTLLNSEIKIDLNKIKRINEIDILSFGGGIIRLKELSKNQFNLIKIGNPYTYSINAYNLNEYCHLLFFDWTKSIDKVSANKIISKLKGKKKELGNNLEGENGTIFFDYFNKLKEKLNSEGILLIMYCETW